MPFNGIKIAMLLLYCSGTILRTPGRLAVVSAFTPTTAHRAAAAAAAATTPSTILITRSASSSSWSSLKASSFLEDLVSKTFSTMTGGGSGGKYYTIGITGASGLIGTALQDELANSKQTLYGKPIRIVKLTRGGQAERKSLDDDYDDDEKTPQTVVNVVWNPNGSQPNDDVIDPNVLSKLDALVHLSGENISTGQTGTPLAFLGIRPWTDAKKKEIIDSRVITTSALAEAIAKSGNKNLSLLVASGVGAYGPGYFADGTSSPLPPADESVDISGSKGFLAEVSRQWEAAAAPAAKRAARVVTLRNGVVLSTKGGAMAKLYPIFFLGGGGVVGSGRQYFPYISARDMARAMVHVLETPSLKGPVNMVAPTGATNADFTTAMGNVLNRPTILPLPAFAVSLLFGEMGEEVLLGGTHATPKKLLDSGFVFSHPTVEEAVRSAVNEKNI